MVGRVWPLLKWAYRSIWQPASPWVVLTAVWGVLQPLLSLFHEITVLATASIFASPGYGSLPAWLSNALVSRQVHGSAAANPLGKSYGPGLAVAGSAGELLHGRWPNLFGVPCLTVDGAWISALIAPGLSHLGQLIIGAVPDAVLIWLGVLLVYLGRQRQPWRQVIFLSRKRHVLALLGLLLQAWGIVGIMSASIVWEDLERAGVARIAGDLLTIVGQVPATGVAALSPWLSGTIKVLALAAVYGLAVAPRLLFTLIGVVRRRGGRSPAEQVPAVTHRAQALYALPIVAMTGLALVSLLVPPAKTSFGAVASVTGVSHRYTYEVDGRPETVRGVGYNVVYRDLTAGQRAQRYEEDFARMRDAGVNTIIGWGADKGYEHDKFDELLLAKAHQYGLGVMMPFYLPPEGDYRTRAYRAQLRAQVVEFVKRFMNHPAVRGWAIGNEVFWGMPELANLEPFAQFYLELADTVHAIDPYHPIIYRDAEDVYMRPLQEAYQRSGVHRPWLVYGMNIFTLRLDSVLINWPDKSFDVAVLITEFGMIDLPPADRPPVVADMWRTIRRHRDSVLGGIVYAWSTAGPEPSDRDFGLVDENGQPVGSLLDVITSEFRKDAR